MPGSSSYRDKHGKPHTNSPAQVNDRGKISSRRGPVSPKFVKEQQAAMQQQQPVMQPPPEAGSEALPAAAQPPRPTSLVEPPRRASAAPPASEEAVASTPQAVVDRMFVRMCTCAALPIIFGLGLLVFFYYQKVRGATKGLPGNLSCA
jgi:hypothetical protein